MPYALCYTLRVPLGAAACRDRTEATHNVIRRFCRNGVKRTFILSQSEPTGHTC